MVEAPNRTPDILLNAISETNLKLASRPVSEDASISSTISIPRQETIFVVENDVVTAPVTPLTREIRMAISVVQS